jgi:hypothetical protein
MLQAKKLSLEKAENSLSRKVQNINGDWVREPQGKKFM